MFKLQVDQIFSEFAFFLIEVWKLGGGGGGGVFMFFFFFLMDGGGGGGGGGFAGYYVFFNSLTRWHDQFGVII